MTSPGLAVENLSLRLGACRLRNVTLDVGAGEILVILGPNGAGKSVTLETIAGFHRPDAGRILIRGRDVTGVPPERRNVGFLFQNFGLFPHLTVAENVAFGLRSRRAPIVSGHRSTPSSDVAELLAQFGIAHLAKRHPHALSPGEKQRVAFARALATNPDLFLFDEPFSALDAPTRERLRNELHAFLRRTRKPAIFVTHDHTDAEALADKILVMNQGEVIQCGTASDIFRTPANAFVAEFVGIENILAGQITDIPGASLGVAVAGKLLCAPANEIAECDRKDVQVCIRADEVRLYSATAPRVTSLGATNRLDGLIVATSRLGALSKVELDCGFPLHAYVMTRQVQEMKLVPRSRIEVEIAVDSIHLLPH